MSYPKFIFLLLFLIVSGAISQVSAQTSADSEATATSDLVVRVQSFFNNLEDPSVNAEAAFNDLLNDSPLLVKRPEQLDTFVESYKMIEASYGRFLVAKQVHVKQVGDDLTFLTFLYETERFPIVWRIAFYRPPIEAAERVDWFVVRLSFDTKIEELSNLP
ncbi:MAG: hypothetical protein H8E66_29580 [Planctomycetes bacterium]|nr:hypothetical protein [Planctomycetota bacterium]